jgi:hypothetical protein
MEALKLCIYIVGFNFYQAITTGEKYYFKPLGFEWYEMDWTTFWIDSLFDNFLACVEDKLFSVAQYAMWYLKNV